MSGDLSEQYTRAVVEAYNANQRNPQQAQIADRAQDLLDMLDRLVPRTTVHYAVEQARSALHTLIREAHTIKTQELQ